MERLQEAIDKARNQRDGKIGQVGNELEVQHAHQQQSTQNGDIDKPGNTDLRARPTALTNVKYTQTRIVEPDDEDLISNRVIAGFIHDDRVEVYRQLRTQVLDTLKANKWNTLAITSPGENAGKTLTATNLAISISKEVNQTVMLVDLDLRKPNVHTTLNIEIEKGIIDCVFNGEPLEDTLINPGFPRVVVLPAMPMGQHSSEILSSPEMKLFLEEVTSRYKDRIIIFDLPPLLRNDDAMVFVPNTDACLMVVEDGKTTPEDIKRSLQLLKNSHLIGTVLNKARG